MPRATTTRTAGDDDLARELLVLVLGAPKLWLGRYIAFWTRWGSLL